MEILATVILTALFSSIIWMIILKFYIKASTNVLVRRELLHQEIRRKVISDVINAVSFGWRDFLKESIIVVDKETGEPIPNCELEVRGNKNLYNDFIYPHLSAAGVNKVVEVNNNDSNKEDTFYGRPLMEDDQAVSRLQNLLELEKELSEALLYENYVRAAELRDMIKDLKENKDEQKQ